MYVYLYLWLCLLCSEYQRHLARRGPEVYVPGYIRAFFQSKTEQIQERQDETLICNLKFVFLSIISLPLIIMNPLVFSENRELRTCWTSGHQLTWLSCLPLLYNAFRCSERNNIQWETQNRCERGTNSTQGMRRSKTHRDLLQASLKEKEIENPSNWVLVAPEPSE